MKKMTDGIFGILDESIPKRMREKKIIPVKKKSFDSRVSRGVVTLI